MHRSRRKLLNAGVVGLLGALAISAAWVRAEEVELSIDMGKPGPAISPYIYGQFIEHLGRCIHDGIWAEKLIDRKFLLEPEKKWKTVSPEGADVKVMHDMAGAYAGDHCMAVWVKDSNHARCGIQQGDIGLLRGKEYVGYAILAHAGATTPVEVRIAWGAGKEDGKSIVLDHVGDAYGKYSFRFTAGATTDSASLSVTLSQPGYLWIGAVSLMPADHVHGMRRDTLDLIKKLHSPIMRWPGGNFVSGYNWKDGIGDRDHRPPRWDRAWNDVEDNDFGIDEFMVFCHDVNIEPLVVVNTGLGSVELAAEEVEYINGMPTSLWGEERVKNGHAQPYGVKRWGIGNEMFGQWQLGSVSVRQYALRHNAFVKAMRRIDPSIQVVAVGAPGRWNDEFLAGSAEYVDLLSGHFYAERKMRLPFSAEDARKFEDRFVGYSACVLNGVRDIVTDMRKRIGKDTKIDRIGLCIDEWGIVRDWNPPPDDAGVGAFESYFCLGDAIAVARGLHELLRSADLVQAAAWPQTVNVLGAIKTTRNYAAMDPVGHVLALYGAELGGAIVPLEVPGSIPLDAVAAIDRKCGVLTLGLINYSPREIVSLKLRLSDKASRSATVWRIKGASLGEMNIPGKPEAVKVARLDEIWSPDQPLVLPAHSITVVRLDYERYRPQFHFSPMKNWMNDPNGMVYYQGEYHLFFQHNPFGKNWGNMTWGHAVSPDMFHWTQLNHAIYPDKLGTVFSGSAVVDVDNTAGFQTGKEKVLVCIYTSAGGTSPESKGQPFTQSIAYSNDRGRTWTKYAGNPVLKHVIGGNRDPKVLWHAPSKQWIMAIYLDGNAYSLFSSPNLKQWSKLCDVSVPGGSECPDFFELPVDGDAAKTKWVFWSANNSYLLGTFDGKTFQKEVGPLRTHYGRHRYAAQTFSNLPKEDGRRIQIAWMNGAEYPDMPFNQQMSLPVSLTLRTFPEGVRLCTLPVKEVESLRAGEKFAWQGTLKAGDNPLAIISGELFDIQLAVEPGTAREVGLTIRGTPIRYDVKAKRLNCLGTSAPVDLSEGSLKVRVLVDRSSIEIFASEGRVNMAYGFLPPEDNKTVAAFVEGGEATVQSLEAWQLKSAWAK